MRSPFLKLLSDRLILALSILLVFLLIFEPYLQLPDFLLFAGRLHPVILHFPIVLLMLTVFNSFTRNKYKQEHLLPFTVLITLLTAITGFLLSESNEVKGEILTSHQWLGSAVALVAAAWYGLEEININKKGILIFLRVSIILLIITTGHYGGMVTHGRDFLSWEHEKTGADHEIPEDPLVFEHMVLPLLESKCISCHNEDKSKGGLILSDHARILRGRESGQAAVPGDPGHSEMVRRIHLPITDEDHMPPAEKDQLADSEIKLLEGWISKGMPEDMRVSAIDTEDPFYLTIQEFMPAANPLTKWKDLPDVDESLIKKLSSDYYTIRRMAENSNALSVMVFPNPEYNARRLKHLEPILDNIVELDLSFLPLAGDEINFISQCSALEWLEIDFTPINDDQFHHLGDMDNLKILKAQGSGLTEKSLDKLSGFKRLEKLFLWNTGIPEDKILELKKTRPELDLDDGIDKNISFISTLPPPFISPQQTFFVEPIEFEFEHPLKEIDILFTLDETDPAGHGTLYVNPIRIEKSGKLKFMASKEGWESSIIDSVQFFKTSRGPDQVRLEYPPDPKYSGKGAASLFDLKKGTFNLQDSSWLGFQQEPMELHCTWNEAVTLKSIILSSFVNTSIHVFPPSFIEVRGGNGEKEERLGICYLPSISRDEGSGFRYYTCSLEAKPVYQLSIHVTPLSALPSWHDAKGKPGWFFVDEIVLEESP